MVLQPFLLSNRGRFCSQFLSKDQSGVAERERGVIGEARQLVKVCERCGFDSV